MKKSERLNQELIFLKDKQQFKIKDLMMEFQISRRTALRDIEDLEKLGLPFYTELGSYGGYQIINQAFLSPVHLLKNPMCIFVKNYLRRFQRVNKQKSINYLRL
ncbi:helix-turn-helix transcriptional regulator [Candidatus Enterococcus ferrettii]|uniref:Helix-turn-helix type 11 domain-containing protein n=1 Tax=Candidatus Enterococcus ferrettii TaxID=2815324 RepID=A0ABV0ELT5_9ENTE